MCLLLVFCLYVLLFVLRSRRWPWHRGACWVYLCVRRWLIRPIRAWKHVRRCSHVGILVGLYRGRSVLSRLSLFFGCSDPVALCWSCSVVDETTPDGTVGGEGLPRINVNWEVLERGLESVLKPLSLPADCVLAFAELPVEQLFGHAVVCHVCHVSCPSDLSLAHDGDDAGDFRTLKNFSVTDFVTGCWGGFEGIGDGHGSFVFDGVCRRSMFRSRTYACTWYSVIKISWSVCCLSFVDVVNKSFVRSGKL